MKKPSSGGSRARLKALGRIRFALCIVAVVLCGAIGFSAASLCAWGKQPSRENPEPAAEGPSAGETETTGNPDNYPPFFYKDPEERGEEAAAQPAEDSGENPPVSAFPAAPNSGDPGIPGVSNAQDEPTIPAASDPLQAPNAADSPAASDPSENPNAADSAAASDPSEIPNAADAGEPGPGEDSVDGGSAGTPTAIPTEAAVDAEQSATAVPAENNLSGLPANPPEKVGKPAWAWPLLIVSTVLLAVDFAGIAACTVVIRRLRGQLPTAAGFGRETEAIPHTRSNGMKKTTARQTVAIGQLHNIGARRNQEDSSGVVNLDDGVFAVVADGMGGLSGGDRVSQKIVYTMLEYSSSLRPGQMDGVLEQMVGGVTGAVNQMLGQAGLQKSGSTLLAVLVRRNSFHWIAVGDSHIYLYHAGSLVQLNQEHNRGQELLRQAIAQQLTFDEVRADPKKSGLTSYIGMGKLQYVEKSLHSIPLAPGDRILLMTDGVFNALPEETICSVLQQVPDVAEAARTLERGVLAAALPHQDNFTAVILGV